MRRVDLLRHAVEAAVQQCPAVPVHDQYGNPTRFHRVAHGSMRPSVLLLTLIIDASLAVASYLLAYRVRFDAPELPRFLPGAIRSLPAVVGSQLAAFALVGLYSTTRRTLWPKILAAVSL